jgi:hypothetical protein
MPDIEVTDVIEHEDGSCTMSFNMDGETTVSMAQIGLKFVLWCAAAQVSTEEALNSIIRKLRD